MAAERLEIPRVKPRHARAGVAVLIATGVVLIAVIAWLWVRDSADRPFAVLVAVVMVLFVVWVVRASRLRTWLRPAERVLEQDRLFGGTATASLATGRVRLVDTRGGILLLYADRLKIVAYRDGDYGAATLSPSLLRALAGAITARTVASQLLAQAEYVEAGGPLEQSPLAALTTQGLLRAAKVGGGAGGAGSLS